MQAACCPVSMCESQDCLQLTERELQVCMTVCASSGPVSFSALKKSVGLHQELVSRILRRLVNYGAVEKSEDGYRRVGQ